MSHLQLFFACLAAVAALLVLLELKTSRPDGALVQVHPYRQVMWYILPSRNESVVYFDKYLDATELLAYLDQAKDKFDATLNHVLVAAIAKGISQNPTMNRFVSGRRLYQRNALWIGFSVKRKKLDREAKLVVAKQRVEPGMTLQQLCAAIEERVGVERSGKTTYSDREVGLLTKIPRLLFVLAYPLVHKLDYYNLLPASFMDGDPLYSSAVISNLGSVGMEAGYHHLFEWGNCPAFVMVGKIEERPWVVDGQVVPRPILHIRFSYDERIDDGLSAGHGIASIQRVLENPFEELGCLKDDGSDAVSLNSPPEAA